MIDDVLDALLDAAGDDGPPVWGSFHGPEGEPSDLSLHLEPSDLIGLVAPPDVWAVGTVTGATARPTDRPGPPRRGRVAYVLDRAGRSASRLWLEGDEVAGAPGPAIGRVPDTIRRVLGLPTDPATAPVGAILGVEWLVELATAAAELGPLEWPLAAALHPAAGLVTTAGRRPISARGLMAATAGWSWTEARAAVVAGRVRLGCAAADLAAWMDDGMLCRWVLYEHPDVRAALAAGTAAVEPAARARVTQVVMGACDTSRRRR
ncbi:MAG TPA: hypothetical protein VFP61_05550 [Acidimicrobiales bacterium]|nr:hypothetical protein [Acidimicrobiales bacterium]